ncbi:hypothetical protein H0A61_02874 [Koleobacter methoxysyntrophicus]|uniref:IrrE N-terminal-like domain-containing protein n=1 Tax=Koleobacter methoxysyntrophicus TaxID=2751313 RepID=A0A8A0RTK2_9FIRM|nr:ImmA/IrrE family metallo-endopeptidase [Koleobacter methoxysyntrophicus]QSQ10466.1 hypothetical protein H0A61_02874 [Koleobacter methoxysyntrophicus]
MSVVLHEKIQDVREELVFKTAVDMAGLFSEPPIDPLFFFGIYGLRVEDYDFIDSQNIEAVTIAHADGYITLVNPMFREKFPRRYRATLAHELGHIVLGHFSMFSGQEQPGDFPEDTKKILEREAWEFAGELLVPGFMLKREKTLDLKKLTDTFQVTKSTMEWRLQKNGLIFSDFPEENFWEK